MNKLPLTFEIPPPVAALKANKHRCLKSALRLALAVVLGPAAGAVAQMPAPAQPAPPVQPMQAAQPAQPAPAASRAPFGSTADSGKEVRHLTIRGKFDADYIKLQNGAVWIEHISFDKPTDLSINGIHWNPVWQGNKSERFEIKGPVAPFGDAKVRVRKFLGRSPIASIDLPTAKNNQTLTIKAIDSPVGVDTYIFEVTW